MFMVSDADAAAIRAAHQQGGDPAGAAELRRLFPGVPGTRALEQARAIAAWRPPPAKPPAPAGRPRRAKGAAP